MFDIGIFVYWNGTPAWTLPSPARLEVVYRDRFQEGTGQKAAWLKWLEPYAKAYQAYYAQKWGCRPERIAVGVVRIQNSTNKAIAFDSLKPPTVYG